jgi:hypothetical protein
VYYKNPQDEYSLEIKKAVRFFRKDKLKDKIEKIFKM